MRILEVLFPAKCPICGCIVKKGRSGICEECKTQMPVVTEPFCKHCGKPVASLETEYCSDCEKRDSSLTEGTALWVYTEQMRKVMADFKYGGCFEDGRTYIREFLKRRSKKIAAWQIDGIIPVPLHWRRKWFRGYNQAEYLAEEIGKALSIPVYPRGLTRIRYTTPQKGLDNKQRSDNLKNAFGVNEEYRTLLCQCKNILLVDDIYTTGATLEECSKVLKTVGIPNIYFACLCIGRDY